MSYMVEGQGGQFAVFMDYNPQKVVALADALDADPKLDCYEYTGNRKLNINTCRVRISDTQLRKEKREKQIEYINAICKRVLEDDSQDQ